MCDLQLRDVPFFLQDFVDHYEGRYHDVQLPLPMRLVWIMAYPRSQASSIGVKVLLSGFVEPALASKIEKVPSR